jgi:dihydroorotase
MSAAAGGFTSIMCMANTDPVNDDPSIVKYILSKAAEEGLVNVLPVAAVTKGLKGQELAEMGLLLEAGAVAFSDDGRPVMNCEVLRRAMEYSRQFKALLISHCEDIDLSAGGMMNEGYTSTIMGLKGIPRASEELIVARDVDLAKEFGAHLHIAHVSTAGSVDIIRRAKESGVHVTCETCPHYFTLTEEEVEGYNTNAKMNPPLRSEEDVKAIVKGLKDGTIDVIATDHAPHLLEEKKVEFSAASFGIVGYETALPLVLTELVDTGALTLSKALAKMTSNPAAIIGKKMGSLRVGYNGDATIIDLKKPITVDVSAFRSKSKNSPYNGWKLKGAAVATIVGGRVVMKNGTPIKTAAKELNLPRFIDIKQSGR